MIHVVYVVHVEAVVKILCYRFFQVLFQIVWLGVIPLYHPLVPLPPYNIASTPKKNCYHFVTPHSLHDTRIGSLSASWPNHKVSNRTCSAASFLLKQIWLSAGSRFELQEFHNMFPMLLVERNLKTCCWLGILSS